VVDLGADRTKKLGRRQPSLRRHADLELHPLDVTTFSYVRSAFLGDRPPDQVSHPSQESHRRRPAGCAPSVSSTYRQDSA
jgi:hypothetical protein